MLLNMRGNLIIKAYQYCPGVSNGHVAVHVREPDYQGLLREPVFQGFTAVNNYALGPFQPTSHSTFTLRGRQFVCLGMWLLAKRSLSILEFLMEQYVCAVFCMHVHVRLSCRHCVFVAKVLPSMRAHTQTHKKGAWKTY